MGDRKASHLFLFKRKLFISSIYNIQEHKLGFLLTLGFYTLWMRACHFLPKSLYFFFFVLPNAPVRALPGALFFC